MPTEKRSKTEIVIAVQSDSDVDRSLPGHDTAARRLRMHTVRMFARVRALALQVRAAARSARRSPLLYGAARRAGAGRWAALQALQLTGLALLLTPMRASGELGRVNAVRHFCWQAGLAARFGEPLAVALADAQEEGAVDPVDSAVDQRNNAAGRAYGRAHADELGGLGAWRVVFRLIDAGLAEWDAGNLTDA